MSGMLMNSKGYNIIIKIINTENKKRGKEMIREINVSEITAAIKEMCIQANHFLSPDMDKALKAATANEESPLGKKILNQLQENLKIAGEDMIPICQDTGMAVFFIEIGQDVHFTGGVLEDAINEGVRQGYTDGYLRKSVVKDPLIRENTKDNTPAVIHYSIVSGDKVKITFAPKGFGSENMSRVFMLKPADGIEGVKNAILTAVSDAGPNACPPMVVGVGVGGTFEKCAIMAKKALTREAGTHSDIEYVAELEKEMLEKINNLGIGPGGLGGSTTALAVNINTYPTHIAGLPVAVNICCHVNRHVVKEL
jgi:fumarate hydratase subunit alpha